MKSLSVTFRVEATKPPTLIDAPRPNRMPFGLTRNTLPLAVKLPRMLEGSAPSTRLSATELLFGCTNRTDSPAAILKLCQLSAAFCVDWLMTVLPAPVLMLAAPAATTPPAGSAYTFAPNDSATEIARACRVRRAPTPVALVPEETFLPALLAFSDTATKVPVSYTHLRAHETRHDLVCRLLLE